MLFSPCAAGSLTHIWALSGPIWPGTAHVRGSPFFDLISAMQSFFSESCQLCVSRNRRIDLSNLTSDHSSQAHIFSSREFKPARASSLQQLELSQYIQ